MDTSDMALRPLLERARPARWIVCERSGRWAIALRRELLRSGVRVHETRNLSKCWGLLEQCPSSFVVVELTIASVDALLDGLVQIGRWFPLARTAVVAERSLGAYEPLAREAGAVYFTTTTRHLGPLARLGCRHLEQAAQPDCSEAERIWNRLPWANPTHERDKSELFFVTTSGPRGQK